MKRSLVVAAVLSLPGLARAHGFDERYDLPVPLAYFATGAAAMVALSFVVAALFARRAAAAHAAVTGGWRVSMRLNPPLRALRCACRAVSLGLFALAVAAALCGTGDPMMNLAPTLIWIIWWVGLSLVAACIGNVWPMLDPWRALFDGAERAARRPGRPGGIAFGWNWPPWLGAWPAVALLLAWSWLEVVFPLAAVPFRAGCAALAWSVVTLAGMLCFGRATWQRNGDVFAIYFAMLGRMAPFAFAPAGNADAIVLRLPGTGLIEAGPGEPAAPAGSAAFVIGMLSIVLFDGLHAGQAWMLLEQGLKRAVPQWVDVNGYFAGSVGLVAVWLALFGAYRATCAVAARLVRHLSVSRIAGLLAPTLVPIAVAYNVAHNFSSLLIQGQNAIPLISDPLGRGWDLFGGAHRIANLGIVDARFTWYVAIGAIVGGHVIAVWLAHRVALIETGTPGRAAAISAPLTALMVAYTAISLLVIAEPMVVFVPAPPG